MSFDPSVIFDNIDLLIAGTIQTVIIAIIAISVGMILGVPLALMKLAPHRMLRLVGTFYVEFFRNVPFIVLLSFFFYGIPFLDVRIEPRTTGIAVLALFGGAYFAELMRAAILAVPKGQMESARAIGMSYFRGMYDVVFPQMLRFYLPAATNTSITIVKESAVLATLSVAEITYSGLIIQGKTFAPFEVFIATALIYWALTAILAAGFQIWERLLAGNKKAKATSKRSSLADAYLSFEKASTR